MEKHIQKQNQITKTPKTTLTDKYSQFIFKIEKKLSVLDSEYMKHLSLNKVNVYVIRDTHQNFGFLYLTSKFLNEGSQVFGSSLNFFKHTHSNRCKVKLEKDRLKQECVNYINVKKEENEKNLEKNEIIFFPCQLYEKYNPKTEKPLKNPLKIHIRRLCFDNELWFMDLITTKKEYHINKQKIKSTLLKDTKISKEIEKILISMLFIQKDNMYIQQETHNFVFTQGGTGKSSILGVLGHNLDTTSNAGMFGYFNVKNNSWISGEVEKTDSPLIVDEINEIMKKGDYVLETLNKPLDNGSYYYGKAGSRNIEFGNIFMFLANISTETHFEHIISAIAMNPETIGRRFCYFVYNDKLDFQQGFQIRPKKIPQNILVFREYYSYIFRYFLDIRKLNSFKENKTFKKLVSQTKEKIENLLKGCEFENTRKFFKEYVKSLNERVPFMAYKLAIFELTEKLVVYENNFDKIPKSLIINEVLNQVNGLFDDILENVSNLINHQKEYATIHQNQSKSNLGSNLQVIKELQNQSKYATNCVKIICQNYDKFYQNKLSTENLIGSKEEKEKFRLFKRNLKRDKLKQNKQLQNFGIKAIWTDNKENNIFFTIINQVIFNKYLNYFCELETTIDMEEIKKETPKQEKKVDEIDEIDDDLY